MNKKFTLPIFVLSLAMCLVSCDVSNNNYSDSSLEENSASESIDDDESTSNIPTQSFHTNLQKQYINDTWDSISKYADGTKELSIPEGNFISLSSQAKYILLSTSANYEKYQIIETNNSNNVRIRNLLSDTVYYWKSLDSNDVLSTPIEEGVFKTSNDLPRNCYIEARNDDYYVTNVRDIGGYSSSLGGKIKQGMVYRGGRLTGGETTVYEYDNNGNLINTKVHEPKLCFSDEGYKHLTETLGIKVQVDLRKNTKDQTYEEINTTSGKKNVLVSEYIENGNRENYPDLIKNVKPLTISIDSEQTDFMRGKNGKNNGTEYIKQWFNILANENNYPMYVHCYIGTDRTGCMSYLLGALLGMSSEALVRDYLFSNFGNIGSSRDDYRIKDVYEPILNGFKKQSLAENAEAYLLSIGISIDTLNSVKNILLEK